MNNYDEVPDKVIIKISIMLEPFIDDITPEKIYDLIANRNRLIKQEPTLEIKQWITTTQAANHLCCTRQTIYNLIKAGKLRHRYLGTGVTKGKLRILIEDVLYRDPIQKRGQTV